MFDAHRNLPRQAQKSLTTSPPFMVPSACQVTSEISFETKRTEPSHNETLTPPACRLRAALYSNPAVFTGMSGSPLGIAQLHTSGALLLGVVIVMNLKTPSSF